jgi:hypothetical protein
MRVAHHYRSNLMSVSAVSSATVAAPVRTVQSAPQASAPAPAQATDSDGDHDGSTAAAKAAPSPATQKLAAQLAASAAG